MLRGELGCPSLLESWRHILPPRGRGAGRGLMPAAGPRCRGLVGMQQPWQRVDEGCDACEVFFLVRNINKNFEVEICNF